MTSSPDFAPPGEFAADVVNSNDYAAERRGASMVVVYVPRETPPRPDVLHQAARDCGYVVVSHWGYDGGPFAFALVFAPLAGVDMRGHELPSDEVAEELGEEGDGDETRDLAEAGGGER